MFKSTDSIVCFRILLFPIVVVSVSQDLHTMPIHWLPHHVEYLRGYSP